MESIRQIFKAAPELALFIALFLGHAIGKFKFKNFSLGGVAGSLLVALVIGQVGVDLPEALKAVCFALFIYSVGFQSGPEFFGRLDRSSLKLVMSSVFQCVVALVSIIIIAKICGFNKGYAVGMGAGALTQTAMMGTAGDALNRLGLAGTETAKLTSEMAVAFAITYVFGTIGVIVFLRSIAPRLMGTDVKKAARELEAELSEGGEVKRPGYISPFVPVVARAFVVKQAATKSVAEISQRLDRASIERILRDNTVVEVKPDVALKAGDVVAVTGRLASVLAAGDLIGQEVEDKEALSFSIEVVNVVVTNKHIIGKTLGEIREDIGTRNVDAVYLVSIKRQGLAIPILLNTVVQRGDVAQLAGRPGEVQKAADVIGRSEPTGAKSDLAYHALGIVIGILVGLITIKVGGIPVTLGIGGGVLVVGLCFGWLHARYPVFGTLPQAAQWILSEFGLSAFAAIVGLTAGPKALAAIQEQGLILLIAGAALTLVPIVATLYFGRFVLKLHPVVLLGALSGGQTVAASLNAVNEATDSMTPVLGFTVAYAISNVLLAVWGPLIVAIVK